VGSILNARNVTYAIGGQKLIEDITLEFKSGELTMIMGQNGAGKSTLLKVLAGSIRDHSGEVIMFQRSIDSYSELQLAQTRAVLSQHYDITFPISVDEVTMMGRYPYFKNTPREEDFHICSEAMKMLGVYELRERDFNSLSGGEAQKVQMARVLSQIWQEDGQEHKILFLDEPVSNLDLHYQHFILRTAKQYASKGTIVIAVLHDINLASLYADRIVFMKSGRVVKTYSSDEPIEKEVLSEVFAVCAEIIQNPFSNRPIFIVRDI